MILQYPPRSIPTEGVSGGDFTGAGGAVAGPPPELLGHPLDSPEFALRWPKGVFVREARYLAGQSLSDVELLLVDAFVDRLPVECLKELAHSRFDDGEAVVLELLMALA